MKAVLLALFVLAVTAVHGSHRAVRQATLDAVVEQLSSAVDTLQAQVADLQDRLAAQTETGSSGSRPTVAFLAQYSDDNALGISSGAYVFDSVVLNVGNGYNPETGIFTAPVSGIYLLGMQLFTDGGATEHPFVDIKVNSVTVARMAFDEATGQEDSDSTMITWQLQAGDQVWIASEEGEEYHYWGQYHTFFTGTLIAAMPNAPGITLPPSPSL